MSLFNLFNRICILLLLVAHALSCTKFQEKEASTIAILKSIADRVIRESLFEFNRISQHETLDIQVIDFRKFFGNTASGIGYALSYAECKSDTTIHIGISYNNSVTMWLNDQIVYIGKNNDSLTFKEIAYGMFVFQDTLALKLHAGINKLLLKTECRDNENTVLLRPLTPPDTEVKNISFSIKPFSSDFGVIKWLGVGPFTDTESKSSGMDVVFPPEQTISDYYHYKNDFYTWITPNFNTVLELKIDPSHVYQRDSYLEWHYATGAMMLGMLALADHTGERQYMDFVERFGNFTSENYDYFKWQYENQHAFRGTNHRLCRLTMLDDSGAPALPILELFLHNPQDRYLKIIHPIADYIRYHQLRLADSTFCRPEPEPQTVWADDLFMSVPFLVRMAEMTSDTSYYDDAARQIINFAEKLSDPTDHVFYHSWNGITKKQSVAKWGRANGWVMWAISDALLYLPKDHKYYLKILKIYQQHVGGLVNYQDESGMWHQVLNHPESFEETSCTAMYTMGILRGIRHEWISKKYQPNALRAWGALQKKIENGIVNGICRGTGIGNDLNYYFQRETFPNDPRGLGAVMVAGIEVSQLLLSQKK